MLFQLVRFLIKCFMYTFFRLKIYCKEHVPLEGTVIVAINHKSFWDAPLIASILPRKLAFMAKKELFDVPVLGSIFRWADAFPVSRDSGDIGAIKAALKALRAGKAMAMFPEGTRVRKGEPHNAKAGVALIAEKTGAPILPVAIRGGYHIFSKIEVFIDEPIYIKPKETGKLSMEELQAISDKLMKQILAHTECAL